MSLNLPKIIKKNPLISLLTIATISTASTNALATPLARNEKIQYGSPVTATISECSPDLGFKRNTFEYEKGAIADKLSGNEEFDDVLRDYGYVVSSDLSNWIDGVRLYDMKIMLDDPRFNPDLSAQASREKRGDSFPIMIYPNENFDEVIQVANFVRVYRAGQSGNLGEDRFWIQDKAWIHIYNNPTNDKKSIILRLRPSSVQAQALLAEDGLKGKAFSIFNGLGEGCSGGFEVAVNLGEVPTDAVKVEAFLEGLLKQPLFLNAHESSTQFNGEAAIHPIEEMYWAKDLRNKIGQDIDSIN